LLPFSGTSGPPDIGAEVCRNLKEANLRRIARKDSLPELEEKCLESLEPFISVFDTTLLPAARAFTGDEEWTTKTVVLIAARLERAIERRFGHQVHPAIVCFSLSLCCYLREIRVLESRSARVVRQTSLLDRAYRLVGCLSHHYGVDELTILLL
jgi:hypothetical protein